MATEQNWEAYADQATLADTDTLLARTAAGAGVEVPGAALAKKDGAGNYGFGTATPQTRVDVLGPENGQFQIRSSTARWRINVSDINGNFYIYDPDNNKFPLIINRTTCHIQPGADNSQTFGVPASRWSTVYAATGTINTSDEREKVWRGGLMPAELAAARGIAGELGFFWWADAVAEKGDDARLHFGVRAQRAWEIMARHGLVDLIDADGKPGRTPYAFLCWDEWPDQPARAAVLDGDGQVVTPAAPAIPGGHRYGVRTDQLALFLLAGQEQRIATLEQSAG